MCSILFLSVLTILGTSRAYDYCSESLCRPGYHHIACGNNRRFSEACPQGAFRVNLKLHKAAIVKLHNEKRNEIAGGGLSRYQPAARMATMLWDKELAFLAAYNVKQCRMAHDECHNTEIFKYSGQNLGHVSYYGQSLSDDELIKLIINGWFEEHQYANMRIINKYPKYYSGPKIGHFTAMVADRNIRVGCAASRFRTGREENFLLACNYASTNLVEQPVYKPSSSPASGCRSGRNRRYRSLCSTAEVYDELHN